MKRRVLSILLAGILAASLGACGSTTTTTSESKSEQPAETETPTEEAVVTETEETQTEEASETETQAETEKKSDSASSAKSSEDQLFEETYKTVKENGFDENGYSNLSFTLDGTTLKDCGDYYTVAVTLNKAVTIDLPIVGGDYTLTVNDLTGETRTFTYYEEDGTLCDDEGYDGYYWYGTTGTVALYQDSDDRVDSPFFEGELRIRKDCQTGAQIMDDIHTLEPDEIDEEDWFNAVSFDKDGYVTALIFVGD